MTINKLVTGFIESSVLMDNLLLVCEIKNKVVTKSSRDWTKCNQLIQETSAEIERHE